MVRLSRTPFKSDFPLSRTVFSGPLSHKTPLQSDFFEIRTLNARKFETRLSKSKHQFHFQTSFSKMASKRKLQTRTLTEKYTILKEIDNGKKCAAVIRDYNIPKHTLYGWMKDKQKIYEEVEASRVTHKRQRLRTATYEDMDKACYKWFVNARHQNIPVSWSIFKAKALYFAKEFGMDKFQASNGWTDRWKKRFNVSFRSVSGMYFLFMFTKLFFQNVDELTLSSKN